MGMAGKQRRGGCCTLLLLKREARSILARLCVGKSPTLPFGRVENGARVRKGCKRLIAVHFITT